MDSDAATSEQTRRLTLQFLAWVAERPAGGRTYAEAMDAWRTSCPRLSVWEDAISDGLVRVDTVAGSGQATVILTPRGRVVLEEGIRS